LREAFVLKKINYKLVALLCSVFILAFAGGALIGKFLDGDFGHISLADRSKRGKPVNILFMGIDARGLKENSRSDTMILASIDRQNEKIAMVWIPRDTRVQVSRNHYNKINSVNFVDGPEAACKTVGDLLDTRVDYYVVTNFYGFEKIINILGGVNIYVEQDMNHWDPDPYLAIHLKKGQQRLNGADSLRYVRYRGTPTADIGRTQQQQKFVKALAAEMFRAGTITKLPRLLPEIAKSIHTNIPMNDMMYLMEVAGDFENQTIITQTLPGYSYTDPASGASYWMADSKKADGILDRLFAGQTFAVNQTPPRLNTVSPVINQGDAKTDDEANQTTDKLEPASAENEPAEDGADINDKEKVPTDDQDKDLGRDKNYTGNGSQAPQPAPIPGNPVYPPAPTPNTPVGQGGSSDPATGSAGY